jgi:bacterial/archaeal transporter family protein
MSYSWFAYAILSAVFAALVAIFAKIGLQNVDSTVATTIRSFIMFAFLFAVISFQGKLNAVPGFFSSRIALFIFLSGIAGALSWLFYFYAIKQGTVTKVVSIDRLSIVFAMVFSFVFLSEKISWKAGLGVAMIAAGAIVVATN